ncbi:aminotransferase class I and II [Hydrogenobacter thermophilus TK-6]|uniref:Aminotransferase n=1 Tax=Hydrogenobacter thermophilus (strain DSM 6534 / IAM 12695 / TK-6) TaxID=608538 RepID=D2Z0I0_HYDTT|nr:aminotransferase class I/II-fold pyridoxal phosphate-dependent enzyme [Hydrogenobacter thermophilus]ADO46204.1 aminotransferase class I and II [Hydrogenobacter thermophilus TK-6]BAI68157.1 aminotransferase [Hydrogenobacter thermophilus TK-6]BAI70284.1 aminotransferase, AspC family [Hydrogenobacter thermophilus TK-6]
MSEEWMFPKVKKLPKYVFAMVNELKYQLRREGEDIVDLGMGNPDIPPSQHIIDKLCEVANRPNVHGYSASKGIPRLRKAICDFYKRRYGVELDPERNAIMTIGAKEGYSHLMLAMLEPGDTVIVPNPTYPIHYYAPIICGGDAISVPILPEEDFPEVFLRRLYDLIKTSFRKPKAVVLSFPHNPTTLCVDLEFFQEVVKLAKQEGIWIVHDFAYADLGFDGYTPPSILQVEGALDVAVELYSMSKGFSMAGWRVAFVVGNEMLIKNLAHLKSYLDYGVFTPIQVASIIALESPYEVVEKNREIYRRRRDVLVEGLNRVGWEVKKPKGSMFVWAKVPEEVGMNSLDFSLFLLREAKVAVSPGIGFGEYGEGYVRFALVENEHRIRQAVRGIKKALDKIKSYLA